MCNIYLFRSFGSMNCLHGQKVTVLGWHAECAVISINVHAAEWAMRGTQCACTIGVHRSLILISYIIYHTDIGYHLL